MAVGEVLTLTALPALITVAEFQLGFCADVCRNIALPLTVCHVGDVCIAYVVR